MKLTLQKVVKKDRYWEAKKANYQMLITNPITGYSFNVNEYINFVSAEKKKKTLFTT